MGSHLGIVNVLALVVGNCRRFLQKLGLRLSLAVYYGDGGLLGGLCGVKELVGVRFEKFD